MAWTIPNIFTSGTALPAAELNKVRDSLKAVGDPWTAYTPVWTASTTNPTLGNGTLTGAYMQAGKLVIWRLKLTFGSTTTVGSGTWSFTLPATAASTTEASGSGLARDDSAVAYTPLVVRAAGGVFDLVGPSSRVNNASPYVWATLDTITASGVYEAA